MEETTKQACRLLFECIDELRQHHEKSQHRTSPALKRKLESFLVQHGLLNPEEAANKLCVPAMTEEQKVVFVITEDKQTVILGISQAAWDHMKEGMTHTLDLNRIGVSIRIMLYGGQDRAEVLKPLTITPDTLDVRGLDFGFGGEE